MDRRRWKRLALLTLGWALVVLGLAGLALPFLQGLLFLAVGLTILGNESPWVRDRLERLRARHPALAQHLESSRERVAQWLQRLRGRGGR